MTTALFAAITADNLARTSAAHIRWGGAGILAGMSARATWQWLARAHNLPLPALIDPAAEPPDQPSEPEPEEGPEQEQQPEPEQATAESSAPAARSPAAVASVTVTDASEDLTKIPDFLRRTD